MQAVAGEHSGYPAPLSGILLRNKSYLTEPYSALGCRNIPHSATTGPRTRLVAAIACAARKCIRMYARRRLSRLPLPACRPSLWYTELVRRPQEAGYSHEKQDNPVVFLHASLRLPKLIA
jgi:hypothetical protein